MATFPSAFFLEQLAGLQLAGLQLAGLQLAGRQLAGLQLAFLAIFAEQLAFVVLFSSRMEVNMLTDCPSAFFAHTFAQLAFFVAFAWAS